MRCFTMFVNTVFFLFLLKLRWPKNKSVYELEKFSLCCWVLFPFLFCCITIYQSRQFPIGVSLGGGRGGYIVSAIMATLNIYNFLNFFDMEAITTKVYDYSKNLSGNTLVRHVIIYQIWSSHGNHILTGIFHRKINFTS